MTNITKLLKDAPKGMKLYSPLFGEVEFSHVTNSKNPVIYVSTPRGFKHFTSDGNAIIEYIKGTVVASPECLLFPSDKIRTWEGWKLPAQPKFKVGDWITNDTWTHCIRSISDGFYHFLEGGRLDFGKIDGYYRLWSIADAKDGDVLVNDAGCIFINAGFENDDKVTLACYCYVSVQGIFHEEDHKTGSWLYVSHIHPATKEQRDLLFVKMKEAGYEWDADKKELRKIKPHYDIANFKPFDKVLVRDDDDYTWKGSLFCYYAEANKEYPFVCVNDCYIQCVPFEGNEHLLGTTDMPSEEYINW